MDVPLTVSHHLEFDKEDIIRIVRARGEMTDIGDGGFNFFCDLEICF